MPRSCDASASPGTDALRWHVWADTGGTFTDCLAVDPDGRVHRVKVLSSSALRLPVLACEGTGPDPAIILAAPGPGLPDGMLRGCRALALGGSTQAGALVIRSVMDAEGRGMILVLDRLPEGLIKGATCEVRAGVAAPVLAAHLVTRTPLDRPLPPVAMRIATTRGTNALLERRGATTALLVTEGFADLLEIGDQQRPDLFSLVVRRPRPLPEVVLEVRERLDREGRVVVPLDLLQVEQAAEKLKRQGIEAAAVALMHSYRFPEHELQVAACLRRAGLEHVSCSAELAPLIKLLPRAETAVVDAYLSPVIAGYVAEVAAAVGRGSLHVMTSAGGLARADGFRAKDSLLSGPAGGVVGASAVAARSGLGSIIAFDMGGTSTDVARWDGGLEYVFEHRVGDARLLAPALAIESVAAGGGSVCHFDGDRLLVGPHSAGADPGPACYDAGGPLAVTDVNLLLGRIDPDRFEIPLSAERAEHGLNLLLDEVARCTGRPLSAEEALAGFLQIANERMASAIRGISVRQGHDPRAAALVAFGGAGPQHAVAVAGLLGISTVLVPEDASLLSALGLGQALVERFSHEQVLEPLAVCADTIGARLDRLLGQARDQLVAEGVDRSRVVPGRRLVALRLKGQESSLEIAWEPELDLEAAFVRRYAEVFGYSPPERTIEVESLRVVASEQRGRASAMADLSPGSAADPARAAVDASAQRPPVSRRRRVYLAGAWRDTPVLERQALRCGQELDGPALVVEAYSVTVVEPGWRLTVDGAGALLLRRLAPHGSGSAGCSTGGLDAR